MICAAVRIGLVVMSVIGAVLVAMRLYEFSHLNVRWDWNAYGSAVWGLLGPAHGARGNGSGGYDRA